MPFCLLTERWLPVRRRSGTMSLIAPSEITSAEPDPAVALLWPRPDFRLASLEFLIGLLATACPPGDMDDWIDFYQEPPTAAALADAFAPFAAAFVLDGDGPRFLQDLEDFASDANPVAGLLIDAPGANAVKRNTDLMVKRGHVEVLSRAAAAMALYTLQSYAPAGGAGNRTSLRGGGPLTTLVIPPGAGQEPSLWHILWSNVPLGQALKPADMAQALPWLAPTRMSDKGGRTTPADAHPLQVWWGMPRRIRLDVKGAEAICDLTGERDSTTVRSWRQRPWGANYLLWEHPLSPYYRPKPNDALLPMHPQPGGIGYQHWLGLLTRRSQPLRQVARTVMEFRDRVKVVHPGQQWRLLAAGYDMDNMKARGFAESEMPVTEPHNLADAAAHDVLLAALVEAANLTGGLLARCVRRALFGDGASIAVDAALLASLRERF